MSMYNVFMKKQSKSRCLLHSIGSWLLFGIGVLGIWQLTAWSLHNAVLCPEPIQVFEQMAEQASDRQFYTGIGATLVRTLTGLTVSALLASAAVLLSFFHPFWRRAFDRLAVILQAIPNIAYIILLLFWTSRQNAVILVIFFLLFPMIYRDLSETMTDLKHKMQDVLFLYPQPWYVMIRKAFLPQLRPSFSASMKSAASLAFKAGIMAEILASVPAGLGRLMQSARLNINVAGVAGYVIWMLLLVFLLEQVITWMLKVIFERQ